MQPRPGPATRLCSLNVARAPPSSFFPAHRDPAAVRRRGRSPWAPLLRRHPGGAVGKGRSGRHRPGRSGRHRPDRPLASPPPQCRPGEASPRTKPATLGSPGLSDRPQRPRLTLTSRTPHEACSHTRWRAADAAVPRAHAASRSRTHGRARADHARRPGAPSLTRTQARAPSPGERCPARPAAVRTLLGAPCCSSPSPCVRRTVGVFHLQRAEVGQLSDGPPARILPCLLAA